MSKPFTSPAMCALNALGSKREIRPIPDRPQTILSQAVAMSLPTGLTMPRPVITTRRFTEHSSNMRYAAKKTAEKKTDAIEREPKAPAVRYRMP